MRPTTGSSTNVLVCSVAGADAAHRPGVLPRDRASASTRRSATYFAFIPLILLVMLLPVTFNGIGTSQAAFVWFFGRVGVPAAAAFALSVLFVALGIVGNLPGGILYAIGRREPAGDAALKPSAGGAATRGR